LIFRSEGKGLLKDVVPELCHKKILKSQFEWECDGQISDIVAEKLGPEIQNMETFLR
jgi:hypothetical protein